MRLFPNHDRPPVDGGGVALWPGRQAEAPPGSYASGPAAAKGRAQPRRRALRYTAAAAIAVGGYIHLCLYRNGFRAIPKIGTGFLLQVVTSVLLAGGLLIGRERILQVGRFLVRSAVAVRALGLSLSLGTLAAFGLTRTPMGLFNFTERCSTTSGPSPFRWRGSPASRMSLTVLSTRGRPTGRRCCHPASRPPRPGKGWWKGSLAGRDRGAGGRSSRAPWPSPS